MNTYEDFVGIQLHLGDAYQTSWTSQRASFYSISGYPTTWFDGVTELVGAYANDTQMYNWYNSARATRAAVPTDVTVEITGLEVGAQTYEIAATVTIEPDGTGKDMICHIVQVLDYYPASGDNRYRNCVIQHQKSDVTLAAGESRTVTKEFTLSGVCWTNLEDVTFVVFVRDAGAPGPKEIHQAATMDWPFTSPYVEGDVDGDGDVDLGDLAALLATYGLCDGDPGYNDAADFIDDDCIDLADLAALLANYGYGT